MPVEPARGILGKLASEIVASAPAEDRAVLAWPLACGVPVAARTRALRSEAGSLIVEVPDRAWQQQLDRLSAQYVYALRSLCGQHIQNIDFVVGANGARMR